MGLNQISVKDTCNFNTFTIDTVYIIDRCFDGRNCPNHKHGVVDSTSYVVANVVGSNYFKYEPNDLFTSIEYKNWYVDIFGRLLYVEPLVEEKVIVQDKPKLTSFDSITVGTKVFPAAKPFVPKYYTHSEFASSTKNNTEILYDISCYFVLVAATIGYILNAYRKNSWGKLINDIITA
jgi:hypothetical protein